MITLSNCNSHNNIKKSPSKFLTGCSTSTYLKSTGKLACVIYLDKKLSFTSAQKACKDLNAALPEIRSKLENKDVWERMVKFERFSNNFCSLSLRRHSKNSCLSRGWDLTENVTMGGRV